MLIETQCKALNTLTKEECEAELNAILDHLGPCPLGAVIRFEAWAAALERRIRKLEREEEKAQRVVGFA